ncbi:Glycoside hydrolase family 131 protein [Pleurotus pulmonarius]
MQLLFATVLALICMSTVIAKQETNAERLARGLTPLPPKFRSIVPGFLPTRSYGAKRGTVSPQPPSPNTYSGMVQVRNSEDRSIGYLKNWAGTSTINGVNFGSEDEDLHVSFTLPPGSNGPFDILVTNPNFEKPHYAGVSTGSTPGSLAAQISNAIAFTNVPQTPPGSLPILGGATSVYVESAIWFFDPETKEITAQFINPDGSKPPTIFAYNIRNNQIFFVGDLDAWNGEHANTPSSAVTFHLEAL